MSDYHLHVRPELAPLVFDNLGDAWRAYQDHERERAEARARARRARAMPPAWPPLRIQHLTAAGEVFALIVGSAVWRTGKGERARDVLHPRVPIGWTRIEPAYAGSAVWRLERAEKRAVFGVGRFVVRSVGRIRRSRGDEPGTHFDRYPYRGDGTWLVPRRCSVWTGG